MRNGTLNPRAPVDVRRRPLAECLLAVDDDASSAKLRAGGERRLVLTQLIVVDRFAADLVPDLDAERVWLLVAEIVAVLRGQNEPEGSGAVDYAAALVLRLGRAVDDEPVVVGALEVQVARLELEVGV